MRRAPAILFLLLISGCVSVSRPISPRAPVVQPQSGLPASYIALQGVWTVTRAQRGGTAMPDKIGTIMHFEGNRFWFEGDRGFEVFEIDATAEPFKIDYWDKGTAVQGI